MIVLWETQTSEIETVDFECFKCSQESRNIQNQCLQFLEVQVPKKRRSFRRILAYLLVATLGRSVPFCHVVCCNRTKWEVRLCPLR
jgi:hypothetical protein